jgi:CRISPR/Cas system CMR-associated protein Cmr5 small subunit
MRNLEQIRAAAALRTAPNTSKAAVSKLPALILANGLLATAAFAGEKKKDGNSPKRPEMKAALNGAAEHLAKAELNIPVLAGARSSEDLIARLSAADSPHLQRASAEALAFLGYVKRFTIKEGAEEQAED